MTEFVFPFDPSERALFTAEDSPLPVRWARRYSRLFDDDDVRIATNQAPASRGGFHYFEWRAAILLYEATGMLSLIESYQGLKHRRKQQVLRRLLTEEQRTLILNVNRAHKAQAPDLLVYNEDYSTYFFCEVKGPGDRLRPPAATFSAAISKSCGVPVVITRFVRLDKLARPRPT